MFGSSGKLLALSREVKFCVSAVRIYSDQDLTSCEDRSADKRKEGREGGREGASHLVTGPQQSQQLECAELLSRVKIKSHQTDGH